MPTDRARKTKPGEENEVDSEQWKKPCSSDSEMERVAPDDLLDHVMSGCYILQLELIGSFYISQ